MSAHSCLFDRVVCGVDHSDAGRTAARVAGVITSPAGALTLVSATDSSIAVHAGWNMAPRALGSLSERIAHEARCSVLVVRSSE